MPGNGDPAAGAQVARVALRLPPFWRSGVRLWLAQCDNAFSYSGITQDDTKYSALVAHLDADVLSHVSDIVINPPETEKYAALSQRLISEFEDTEHQKIKKLLTDLQLGDERPSHLLRKMKDLSGGQLKDDFLQNLWMQRMPAQIQTVLSASSEPLDKLALIADKVAEVVLPSSSAVCATATSHPPAEPSTAALLNKIEELSLQIAELKVDRSRFRQRQHRSPYRWRSHS